MNKLKFSIRSLVEDLWQETKQELHKLGFAIFENAKTNEVVLVHDAELAGVAAVEGNEAAVFDDAKNAALVLMEQHTTTANANANANATTPLTFATPNTSNATPLTSASLPKTEAKHDL